MQQAKPEQRSHWGLIIIVGILAIIMFILIAIIAIVFIANQMGSSRADRFNPLLGKNLLAQLDTGKIDPALALSSLGGVSELDVISSAIEKNRAETALAALLFTPTLENRESAGSFLQLADAYAQEGDLEQAAFSYELAGTVATLAPDVSDTVRSDVFLQASEGLIELNELTLAKFYLDQTFAIALGSPYLQAAHRRGIFERLQKNYLAIDERELARESLNLSANPPNLTLVTEERAILPKNQPVPLPAEIQEAEAKRWLAAQELAAQLVSLGGKAAPEAINALADALVLEDQLKLAFFDSELESATLLSKRLDLILAKIGWLSIKYRVARNGYGLSIVPEWETQAEQIRADLTKTYEPLYALYSDIIIGLPEVSQIDKATEERLRTEILAGELGRYPNYPEEQRRAQLLNATEQLVNTQPELGIFVGVGTVGDREMFTLITLE